MHRLRSLGLIELRCASLLILSIFSLLPSSPFADLLGQEPKTPLPTEQPVIDFTKRLYVVGKAGKLTVQVEKQLMADEPEIAKKALARLDEKLAEAFKAVPKPAQPDLRKLRFFLMYGTKAKDGGRNNGLEYFRKNSPKFHKHLDPKWENCIVIYCAENYVQITDFWALKALVHEFAHAHQLEHGPEEIPIIRQAWENATKLGLYRKVKDNEGKEIEKAYASVNHLEYFAELSCMYFVGCNYQPFNRKELKEYDPTGYAMVQKMWGVKD